jgi:histidyl-tRNA synthetase
LYKAPRGTADILPREQGYWRYVEEKAASLCQLSGYQRITTPVFEDLELFTRIVSEGTDIVDKEMYVFEDRSGQKLALSPEGTAPVCRAYLQHGLYNLPQPIRLYYIGPAFRYERPQAGRYRQHHQFGIEAIGDADPALDAEVIELANYLFLSLGLCGFSIRINSIGCKTCRPKYVEALKRHYSPYSASLCADCRVRLTRNPLRLLDCKKPSCQEVASTAPKSVDYLCAECRLHFERVQEYLTALGLSFHLDHRLVRGLDYYTRTVFEIQSREEGAQNALGGGGRYDDLIEALGGKATPAVGFAAGIERIISNIKAQKVSIPGLAKPRVFVAYLGEEAKIEAMKLSSRLRTDGIGVMEATGNKSLKAQLRQANASGTSCAVIIGKKEVESRSLLLRNMGSGEQRSIPQAEILTALTQSHLLD